MTPREYLATLQKDHGVKPHPRSMVPGTVPPGFPPGFLERAPPTDRRIIEHLQKKANRRERTSDYEDSMMAQLMESMCEDIQRRMSKLAVERVENLAIGSLQLGQLNATTMPAPDGGHVIAVNEGAFVFIHLVAKAVASFIHADFHDHPPPKGKFTRYSFPHDAADAERFVEMNPGGRERFLDAFSAYLLQGRAGLADQYWMRGPQQHISNNLRAASEYFLLAHEYGHLLHNHVGANVVALRFGSVDAVAHRPNWEQEFEADSFAFVMGIRLGEDGKVDQNLSYAGMDFLLTCMAVIDRVLKQEDGTPTHPPWRLRRARLRELLKAALGPEAETPLRMAASLELLVDRLWAAVQGEFAERMALQGLRQMLA